MLFVIVIQYKMPISEYPIKAMTYEMLRKPQLSQNQKMNGMNGNDMDN